MGPLVVLGYLAGALAYAGVTASIGLGAARLAGIGVSPGRALLALSALFVVFLALHPFPGPGTLDCAEGGVPPRLTPFQFLDAFIELWRRGAGLGVWATDLTVTSTIMNVVFFALVGAALRTETRSWAVAAGFACALTAFIEASQATGLWWIYDCPYRQFDVDDLMLNVAGVLIGFGLAGPVSRRFRRLV